jgi:hypothetical protein
MSNAVLGGTLNFVAVEARLDRSTPITLPGGTVARYSDASFSYNNGKLSYSFLCSVPWNACSRPNNAFVTRAGTGEWSAPG